MNNLHGTNKTTNLVATMSGNNVDYPMFGVQQTSEGYTTSTDRPTGDVLQRSQGNSMRVIFIRTRVLPQLLHIVVSNQVN